MLDGTDRHLNELFNKISSTDIIELDHTLFTYFLILLNRDYTSNIVKLKKIKHTECYDEYELKTIDSDKIKTLIVINNTNKFTINKLIQNIKYMKNQLAYELVKDFIFYSKKDASNIVEFKNTLFELKKRLSLDLDNNSDEIKYIEDILNSIELEYTKLNVTNGCVIEKYNEKTEIFFDYNIGIINNESKLFETSTSDNIHITNISLDDINNEVNEFDAIIIDNEVEIENFKTFKNILLKRSKQYSEKEMKVSNQPDLVKFLNFIKDPSFKRIKIIQSEIDPDAWYADKIGNEYFVTIDGTLNEITVFGDEDKSIWGTDCNISSVTFKGKKMDVFTEKERHIKIENYTQLLDNIVIEEGKLDNIITTDSFKDDSISDIDKETIIKEFNSYIESKK